MRKKFIMIFVFSFMFILALFILIQQIFLEDYVERAAEAKIHESMYEFKDVVQESEYYNENVEKKTNEFSLLYNSSILKNKNKQSENGEWSLEGNFINSEHGFFILSSSGTDYYCPLDIWEEVNGFLRNEKIKAGDKITVQGIIVNHNTLIPLAAGTEKKPLDKVFQSTTKLSGTIKKIQLNETSFESRGFYSDLTKFLRIVLKNREDNIQYHSMGTENNEILAFGNENYLIFVQYTLKKDNSIINTLRTFNLYVALISLVFPAIIAIILAYSLTKPIKTLNTKIKEIEKIGFSEETQLEELKKRKDEIGELARSFETKGRELNSTLLELDRKNLLLKEAYNEKVRSEEERQYYISNLSHQLKTPLSIIRCEMEGIVDGLYPPDSEEAYNILKEIKKMTFMINQIVIATQLESIENGEKENCLLSNITEEILQQYKFGIAEKEIEVKTFFMSDNVNTWKKALEVILNGLIQNAVKYCSDGGTIKLHSLKTSDGIRIFVENPYDKMIQEDTSKYYQLFYRSESETDSEGSGVGLYIIKKLYEACDFKYGTEKTEEGLQFWFEV